MNQNTARNSLTEYVDWKFLGRCWPLLLLGAVGAGILAAGYVSQIDRIYESSVRVVVQKVGLGIEGPSITKTHDSEFLSTQAEILISPTIIARSLQKLPYPTSGDAIQDEARIVEKISKNLRANTLAKTDIVRLTYQHEDPRETNGRLEAVVESYRGHLRETEQTAASRSAELLAGRKAELDAQIEERKQELAQARESSGEIQSSENPLLRELTRRWVEVQTELATTETMLAEATSGSGNRPRLRTPDLANAERELHTARTEMQTARNVYGPSHPEFVVRTGRLQLAEQQYRELLAGQQTELQSQQLRLQQEATRLKGMIDTESQRLQGLALSQSDEESFQAEIAHLMEMRDSAAATLETMKLADRSLANGRSSVFIDVIDPFLLPDEPVWPQPVPIIAVAFLIGGLASLIGLILLDSFRQTRTPATQPGWSSSMPEQDLMHQVNELRFESIVGAEDRRAALQPRGAQ